MKHYTVKTWGSGAIAPPFFTLTPDGGELSALCPCRFTARERDPGADWIGGCVGPRFGMDGIEKYLALMGIEP
jgi:hypothetical protein